VDSKETIFTGERVVPGAVESDLWNEHVARYRYAALFAVNKIVLDIGCGTGYGTSMMASVARDVIGFDVSEEAVRYATESYGGSVCFGVGSASALPTQGVKFDLVTAFEVIEHIAEWRELVKEAARVMKPTGVFLVSTPNKTVYNASRRGVGANPFHVHEFEELEFRRALEGTFRFVKIVAQNQQSSVVVAGDEAGQYGEVFVENKPPLRGSQFFLAICSFQRIPIPAFAYIPSASNLLQEREQYIESLKNELEDARWQHRRLMNEHERLHEHLNERTDWAQSLDRRLQAAEIEMQRLREQQQHERNLIKSSRWFKLGEAINLGPKLPDDPV
jgi:SAM-dependent methyltransferase